MPLSTYPNKQKSFYISHIFLGLLFLLLFISAGLLAAIYLRPVYYLCIKLFDIPENSGLPISQIKENYNALIDYCSPFFTGELSFPSLTSSASALSHFSEVKTIFTFFHITFAASIILLIIFCPIASRKGHYFLRNSAIICIILPIIVSIGCAINFNYIFFKMHNILFNNDDWLFDPITDPVITILPENYFLVCAGIIILFIFVGSFILYLIYRHFKKKNTNTETLYHKQANYIYTKQFGIKNK